MATIAWATLPAPLGGFGFALAFGLGDPLPDLGGEGERGTESPPALLGDELAG